MSQVDVLRQAVREPVGTGWTGSIHLYSNIGYMLLGRIIEQV